MYKLLISSLSVCFGENQARLPLHRSLLLRNESSFMTTTEGVELHWYGAADVELHCAAASGVWKVPLWVK